MTFYYDHEEDELVGNNMFAEDVPYGPLAEQDGDTLRIDVEEIMEEGRGLRKLNEMKSAIQGAIDEHDGET
jgi:hypothetical protein